MIDVFERIKKALFDKGWSQKKLCAEIDISENGLKRMADNNSWKLETLQKMATVLEVPVAYFVEEDEQKYDAGLKPQTSEAYLQDFLVKMEANFARLTSELDSKNQQIAGLQRMLESVLGKSEGAINLPALYRSLTQEEKFDLIIIIYRIRGTEDMEELFVEAKPKVNSVQRMVAPRFQLVETRQ